MDFHEPLSRFLINTIDYLEKWFARLSSLPLCDFIVFDYLNFPFKEDKELAVVKRKIKGY